MSVLVYAIKVFVSLTQLIKKKYMQRLSLNPTTTKKSLRNQIAQILKF